MIIVGHDAAGAITHTFSGSDEASLIASAQANGCAGWLLADGRPDPKLSRVEAGAIVPAAEAVIAEAARVGMSISPRQLFIALAARGLITETEAVAAATVGAMPAAIEAAIAGLEPIERMAARVTWARMQTVQRLDPLVGTVGASQGLSPAQIDDIFAFAATI